MRVRPGKRAAVGSLGTSDQATLVKSKARASKHRAKGLPAANPDGFRPFHLLWPGWRFSPKLWLTFVCELNSSFWELSSVSVPGPEKEEPLGHSDPKRQRASGVLWLALGVPLWPLQWELV